MVCLKNAKYRGTLGRNEGGGGCSNGFCGENQKVPGYFLQVGGWVPALKIPFFQKMPSKEDLSIDQEMTNTY